MHTHPPVFGVWGMHPIFSNKKSHQLLTTLISFFKITLLYNLVILGKCMPPQVKVPRDVIVDKAFELTRAHGFEKVTARMLAKELNCSTQPVYHTFRNMEDLKGEVYRKTQKFFEDYMMKKPADGDKPDFLSMGMRYVELARKEKNLFKLLCLSDSGNKLKSFSDLADNVPLHVDPDVFVKTWIFTQGVATIVSSNTTKISTKEIEQMLTEAGKSFYTSQKGNIKEGSQ